MSLSISIDKPLEATPLDLEVEDRVPDTLMVRSLVEVFEEPDAVNRRHAIRSLYAADCIVCGPDVALVGPIPSSGMSGHAWVATSARRFQGHFLNHYFSVVDTAHLGDGVGMVRWMFGPLWNPDRYRGLDIAACRNGRIRALSSQREPLAVTQGCPQAFREALEYSRLLLDPPTTANIYRIGPAPLPG
jgi:hypothetical protein